jgi:hypothetical protein
MASFVNPLINTLAQTPRTTSHFLITQQEKFLGTLSCTPIMLHRQCSPSNCTSSTASTRNILSAVAMQKAIEDCYNPPAEYNKLWNLAIMSQVCWMTAMVLTDKNFVVCTNH